MSNLLESTLTDLGYSQDKSEDFCSTLLGILIQHSSTFAGRLVQLVIKRASCRVDWPDFRSIRISGQECIGRYMAGCNRFPDLWIRGYAEGHSKPYLVIIEVKVGSGESNDQMIDYRRFVDTVRLGDGEHFQDALLAFLSFSDRPMLSANPDAVVTWQIVIDLIADHMAESSGFEASFVSSVHRHLSHVRDRFVSRPPLGTADDFVAMLQGLPGRYAWLEYFPPQPGRLQHTVMPNRHHPWVKACLEVQKGTSAALIGVDPHRMPHLNSFPETWLRVLMPAAEDTTAWYNRVKRVKHSIPDLQSTLEDILQSMDDRRRQESA